MQKGMSDVNNFIKLVLYWDDCILLGKRIFVPDGQVVWISSEAAGQFAYVGADHCHGICTDIQFVRRRGTVGQCDPAGRMRCPCGAVPGRHEKMSGGRLEGLEQRAESVAFGIGHCMGLLYFQRFYSL